MRRPVILRGGHFDGQPVEVNSTQSRIVLPYDRGEGLWEFEDRAFVTRLVDFDLYERVDDETFRVAA